MLGAWIRTMARRTLLAEARRRLMAGQRCLTRWPPIGLVRFGDLRRVTPISTVFGLDRGRCIDRYYIETFLARHATEIRGRVLEIGDNIYTWRFGGDRVVQSDILDVASTNRQASIIADLARAD